MLLKNQFGVGNLNAVKQSLSMDLSNTDFIMTSISRIHSSLQNGFIEFLFKMQCDWLPMLKILTTSGDIVISSYIPNIINAYVSRSTLAKTENLLKINNILSVIRKM